MPAVEVPVPSVGIGGVEVFDEVVPLSDEEVISEHDANETSHENTHSGDAGEEDGARDENLPWHHAPAADDAADHLPADDIDVARCHCGGIDAERDQICDKISADLADHENEGH